MSNTSAIVDNLVIGGGLAGSMAALRLAAAGCAVTLLEKEISAHHKVCGEFLSSEAVEYLRQVGIDPLELGATTIRFVRLSSKRSVSETALPFTALSLSRFSLDEAILSQAVERGCDVQRGAFVERLTTQDSLWFAQLRYGKSLCAQTVFLASGKHDLHGWVRPRAGQSDLVAFKMHWQLSRAHTEALREFIEIFLFSGGYGGLALVERDAVNMCLAVRRARLRSIGGWNGLLASILDENRHMQQRMHKAKPLWDKPFAISPIPYGYLAGRPCDLWRVGDQAAVVPSFTGDGMSIALHSAVLATEMYLAGKSVGQYDRRLHTELGRGISLATLLSRTIVTDAGRYLAPFCLSLFPGAMRWIAASTRIPEHNCLTSPNNSR